MKFGNNTAVLEPFSGITFERAVDRAMVSVIATYQLDEYEPLVNVDIHPGITGLPLIMNSKNPGEDAPDFKTIKDSSSHIVVMSSGYEERESNSECETRIIIKTQTADMANGENEHEQRIAAIRGIFSEAASDLTHEILSINQPEIQLSGWERTGVTEDVFDGNSWVYSETYKVRGSLTPIIA